MKFKAYVEQFPADLFSLRYYLPPAGGELPHCPFYCFEFYPEHSGRDQRRVLLALYPDNQSEDWAFIHIWLDPQRPDYRVFLHPDFPQSDHAEALLGLIVEDLKEDPSFLHGLQEHFRLFRSEVTGRTYNGRQFFDPQPGWQIDTRVPDKVPAVDRDHEVDPLLWLRRLGGKVNQLRGLIQQTEDQLLDGPLHTLLGDDADVVTQGDADFHEARPPASPEDMLHELDLIVEEMAKGLQSRQSPPILNQAAERFLERHHIAPLLLLELMQREYPQGDAQPGIRYQLIYFLFCESLHKLCYALDRHWRWAAPVQEQLIARIADSILVPHVGQVLQQDVMEALRDSNLEWDDEIIEATQNLADYYNRFSGKDSYEEMEAVLQDMEDHGLEDAYAVAEILIPQLKMVPIDGQVSILEYLAHYKSEVMCEVVGLMCLHSDPQVRRYLPSILDAAMAAGKVSPVTFRRLIMLRNWLPIVERSELDRTIKALRMARLDIPGLVPGRLLHIYASLIDGSGSQGFWLAIHHEGRYVMGHILVKQDRGIQDVWCSQFNSAEALAEEMNLVKNQITFWKVDRVYLDLVIRHQIGVGHGHRKVPPPELMRLAEYLGEKGWDPRLCEPSDLIREHIPALPKRLRDPAKWASLVNQNPNWLIGSGLQETWFDDDEMVETVLHAKIGKPRQWLEHLEEATEVLLHHIFEPNRRLWMERFLWTALWLRYHRPKPKAMWSQFLIHAGVILDGMPLGDLAAMGTILIQTLYSVYYRSVNEPAAAEDRLHLDSLPDPVQPAPVPTKSGEELEPPGNLVPFNRGRGGT
ncbi:hypothetical protein SCOR_31755 [Sulfidibacter corallicola]|uniref:Uncharacterized protein n=1 Tax=Sulfidibacter corallicola TaxID=2818388 RepID=A0A8A4TTL3_SULCO|nr:hypothetical protein [Sulfidibacter corallicola]QTD49875.1 hypothetical protein J3U87_30200 [Sulfidibacter corallicola]